MPIAEVNLGILKVCFGGVVNQSLAEAEYIGWGGLRETEGHAMGYSLYIFFSENASHTFMGCSLLAHIVNSRGF